MSAFLADAIVIIHFAFIVFAAAGAWLALWWRWIPWVHVPCAAWAAYVVLSGTLCPLTPMELALRYKAGEAGYSGGFIEHYILPIIYPPGLTREVQMLLGVIVVMLNAIAYAMVIRRWTKRRP